MSATALSNRQIGVVLQSLLNNATTTLATNTDTNLSVPVLANEVWVIEYTGNTQCSSTGGSKFQISAPTGSTIEGMLRGSTSAIGTLAWQRITAINALNATVLHNIATTPAEDRIQVRVKVGATPGNIKIGFASVTAGQTTTIFAGAMLCAYKVTEV